MALSIASCACSSVVCWKALRSALDETRQEQLPTVFHLRLRDLHAENFTLTLGMDAEGDEHCRADDAAAFPHLEVHRVEPDIREFAFQRPLSECLHVGVETGGHPRYFRRGPALRAHRFDDGHDLARGDAADVSLGHHVHERLFPASPWHPNGREVTTLAQLRDVQLHAAETRFQYARTRSVAAVHTVQRTLPVARPANLTDLRVPTRTR